MKKPKYFLKLYKTLLLFSLMFFSYFAAADTDYFFVNTSYTAVKWCLDNDGTNVYALQCNQGAYQKWTLTNDGVLYNKQTNRCINDNGSGYVNAKSCDGTNNQKWLANNKSLINKVSSRYLSVDGNRNISTQPLGAQSQYQEWFGKDTSQDSGCSNFYVKSNGSCVYAGYSNCPANGHWDSAVRGTGGCACNTGYFWDGAKCAATQAVVGTTTSPQPVPVIISADTQVQNPPPGVIDTPYVRSTGDYKDQGFNGVKVYRDDKFGDQLSIGPYGTNFSDGGAQEGYFGLGQFEANAISSMRISPEYQVELFENADFTGQISSFRGNINLVPEGRAKFAKSMRIWQPKPDSVSVYQDVSASGKELKFLIGDFPSLRNFDMNDQMSSLTIPKGWMVVLYEHSNFQGKSKVFTNNTSGRANFSVGNDFNDVASSMRIIENLTIGDWGDFKTSCQYAGKGQSFVQYEARLWNAGSEWDEACKNKGAWLNGQWLQRPAACDKDNIRPAITTILSVAGVFTPFLSGAALVSGAAASAASQTAAFVTVAKDNVPLYSGVIATGIWGTFLVRDEKQCNVLYQKYSSSCLGAYNTGSVFFASCENDSPQAKIGKNQFIRDGENFSFYSINRSTGGLSRDCLHADLSNNVSVKACDGSNYQNWQLIDAPGGFAQYKNRQTGMCLDGNGAQVYTNGCNAGNPFQEWK